VKTLTTYIVFLALSVMACSAEESIDFSHGTSADQLSDCLGNPCAEIMCDGDEDSATACVCRALPDLWSCNDPFQGTCKDGRCVYGE
jgi:hypothetical protein